MMKLIDFCMYLNKCPQYSVFPKKKRPAEPISVIHIICHWIDFWVNLRKEEEREMLLKGARAIEKVVAQVFGARSR